MDVLSNPMGRIGPAAFRNTALVLIAIGACFSLLPWLRPDMALLSFVSLLLFYPWCVIWMKRLHDAGKSGKLFLAILAVWMVIGVAVNHFIVARFIPAPPPMDPHFIMASMKAQMQANAVPGTIAGALVALAFALFVNAELKSDPGENEYGPPPAR
jgi:uncharacterized membrane protein YhaH (DUF805 family)